MKTVGRVEEHEFKSDVTLEDLSKAVDEVFKETDTVEQVAPKVVKKQTPKRKR